MQELNMVVDSLRALLHQVGVFLPRLGVALIVLLLGWLIAKVVRLAVIKALRALNFHVLTERAGIDGFLQQGGTEKDTTDLFGAIAYLLVILASLIVAANSLGLEQVTDLLGRVLLFVPKLLVALLVVVFGSYFARFAGRSVQTYCRGADIADAELLGLLMQYGVMAFVVLLAIDHLDIGGGLIQQTFLILLGGVVVALALAFGFGGRERAAALIERWFPRDRNGADPGQR
jgi:Conserved TM helix